MQRHGSWIRWFCRRSLGYDGVFDRVRAAVAVVSAERTKEAEAEGRMQRIRRVLFSLCVLCRFDPKTDLLIYSSTTNRPGQRSRNEHPLILVLNGVLLGICTDSKRVVGSVRFTWQGSHPRLGEPRKPTRGHERV
ncbi:hypothetical protein GW17_00015999 [Ensete ventricosum]|uniref:Uncharacterized protein n=1 Tax=Ensete ventricosum TaxID=4639 RepID=A0A444FB90_ENSVE|nr:hypothetical protein GW17_00015999 [Ensete ventricosum]RZR71210.1 hypothetical protein BHM03_00004183 [Ensete ventricosum]